ncbi:putative zinc finger protein 840 isoform X2 [Vanessa cardui]|uniref:putative zinc finger protein 840 isoform X2 n=1 Tax=Vanessa cardui TaxID=171605 RepID=UPI001F132C4A|nr:putative zinc finger protein 840 isoform X2 [Vanessa cardui]
MTSCRICLENQEILYPLNDSDSGVNCASMIASISNIAKGSTDMICQSCRKKLEDFYDFKLLIERSDVKLNKTKKVLKFNSIDEVGLMLEVDKKGLNTDFNCSIIKNESDSIYYNNTLIKRLNKDKEKEPLPVEDFLKSVKYENDEHDYMELSESDTSLKHEDYRIKKKQKRKSKDNVKKSICLKPVYRKDLRLIKTNIRKTNKQQSKIQGQPNTLREDICPYCGKKTKAIKSHILQHTAERKFSCNNCNRSFYTKQKLESHMKTHFVDPKFKCDHCIASFYFKGALARHMVAHTDIREFTCKICEKTFKWKSGLHRHMLIHNFAKRFNCEMCKMSFATKYAFQHHYRVHTGERPYKCELCSQPYSYKRDFNRHCLKKHGVLIDRRPVTVMNEEVLKQEQILMKDLILRLHGIKTEREPLDYFQGPQGALAFAKAVKVMQNKELLVDVNL